MVIAETLSRTDPFQARIAVATTLEKMARLLSQDMVAPIFDFLVAREALGDRHPDVRKALLSAGIAIIDLHGELAVTSLMKMFEDYLGKSGQSSETADFIKEAVVIVSRVVAFERLNNVISSSVVSLVILIPRMSASRRS